MHEKGNGIILAIKLGDAPTNRYGNAAMTTETPNPKSSNVSKRTLRMGVAAAAIAAISFGAGGMLLSKDAGSNGFVPRQTYSYTQLSQDGLRAVAAVTGRAQQATPPRLVDQGSPFSFADLVEHVSPAVVTVVVDRETQGPQAAGLDDIPAPFRDFFRQFGGDGQGQGQGQGQGPGRGGPGRGGNNGQRQP